MKLKINVPMSSPDLTEDDVAAVNEVLSTRYLSIGPRIAAFEEQFAAYVGSRHAVGVSSGTAGLHLAVIAAGIKENDLVITTPFSFISSANCMLYERAVPVFVDIDPQTLNIDPGLVAQAADDLTHGSAAAKQWFPPALQNDRASVANLKAILAVDAFGQPADYDPLQEIAERHDLTVIEDSCEAIGAEYKGRKAGTLGGVGVFAFYPNKQMTTGEGGMLVTDHEEWDALFRSLRNQGRDVFDAWLNHTRLGYNYRLDEMSAALGLSQLNRIDELLAKRERVAERYNERLQEMDGVTIPYIAPTTTRMSWFVYVIRLAPEIDRDRILAELKKRGVPSRPYFTPIHLQPFYREKFRYKEGSFPVTESVARSVLALPFYSAMEEEKVDYVCGTLQEVIS